MPMTINTQGLDELSDMISKLGDKAEGVAAQALYDGAGIVADAFSKAANSIRTEKFKGKKDHRLPSPEEKSALFGKTGIAKFNKNGSEVDTLIGFTGNAGYAQLGSRSAAVVEIARSINSGTSFMDKQSVFRKAKGASQGAAKAAVVSRAEELFEEIING